MTAAPSTLRPTHLDDTARRLVLIDNGPCCGYALLPWRRRQAVAAALRHRSLDRRLAAGEVPESSPLLAVRAAQLVSPKARRRVAGRWEALARRARQAQARSGGRRATSDESTAEHFQRVADTLRVGRPVVAQGVAIAATMAVTASTALPRLGLGGDDLAAAIARHAVTAMNC